MPAQRIKRGDYEFVLWEQSIQINCRDMVVPCFWFKRPVTESDVDFLYNVLMMGEGNTRHRIKEVLGVHTI